MVKSAHWLLHFWKGLDKNYRPISYLQYFSKLVERALFEQTHQHLICPVLQSSYRAGHSILKRRCWRVVNDIMLSMNSQCVTLFALLDLSAAFDAVNREIIVIRLQNKVGLQGAVLNWFKTCFSNRSQRYLSVECFRDASNWIAGFLKALV